MTKQSEYKVSSALEQAFQKTAARSEAAIELRAAVRRLQAVYKEFGVSHGKYRTAQEQEQRALKYLTEAVGDRGAFPASGNDLLMRSVHDSLERLPWEVIRDIDEAYEREAVAEATSALSQSELPTITSSDEVAQFNVEAPDPDMRFVVEG